MKYALIAATALLSISTANAAPTFDVYAGYGDTLRPNPTVPSPWVGDSGVVSESASGQSFDAGAIRIANNSAAPFSITNFTVSLGGQTFALWSSLSIPAADSGVFTQTLPYNFDTSDLGAGAATVTFSLNGAPFSFVTDSILNTGGTDPGLSGITNEGLPWTLVGTQEIPTPEPVSLAVLGVGLLGMAVVRRR